jgi:exonuclease VII small subunit
VQRLQKVEQVIQQVKERSEEQPAEQTPPDESIGEYIAEAATYAFKKADAEQVDEIFRSTGMGYSGTPLTDAQRRKLNRVEQVVSNVRAEAEKTIDENEEQ